jgi:hypothetical protein
MIFNYDGTFETYSSKESIDPIMRGVFQIDEKWEDAEGDIWYKIKMIDMYGENYHLMRISEGGENLEFVRKPYKYPELIKKEASGYSNYSVMHLK